MALETNLGVLSIVRTTNTRVLSIFEFKPVGTGELGAPCFASVRDCRSDLVLAYLELCFCGEGAFLA